MKIYISLTYTFKSTKYLQSSSTISTLDKKAVFKLRLLGNDDFTMDRRIFSIPSNILSSNIATSNETLVIPAGNVTVYGPES